MAAVDEGTSTRDRLIAVATHSFATRGYEATSLDDLAAAVGVRKQTLLYYHPSKEALLEAVVREAVDDLAAALRPARSVTRRRDAAFVDAVFRLGSGRPELLDLVREVLRLGPPASTTLVEALEPLLGELVDAMGGDDRGGARRTVLTAAAMVVGMATEVEVLRGLGVEPSVGALRRRRRALLDVVRRA